MNKLNGFKGALIWWLVNKYFFNVCRPSNPRFLQLMFITAVQIRAVNNILYI